MRILIIKGQSQYGGTRLFADQAAQALERRGHAVEVLDLGDVADGAPRLLAHAATARVDLIFTINIAGEFHDAQGRSLADLYGAPHVVWHTDYVLSQVARLRSTPRSTAILVVDPTQAEGLRSIYGQDRFDHVGFFPHPAVGEPAPDDATLTKFLERRPIEVLWSGGYQLPDLPWRDVEGPARQLYQDAFDLAVSQEWIPPLEALDTVLASRGIDLGDPAMSPLREAAGLIDVAVRSTRRFAFLEALAQTGLPLRICGAGWESQLHRFRNAAYEGAVDMTRMVDLMRRSRLVLNTNGNFGAGSHERPFSASLAGAATFSDLSRYYAQVFEAGRNIELFRWKDLAGGMDRLTSLAADPQRCFDYARSAKAVTLAGHTWDVQVEQILQAGEAVRR
ncbi:MAG: glycosyltransferase family protein [Phenylobacterium sp.]